MYDPESFGVRVGDEVYPQTISDAGGLVSAGKTQTVIFVVAGNATGGRNDLAATNKFDIVMRQVIGERDPHRTVPAEWQEPALPTAQSGFTPGQLRAVSDEKVRKSHKHRAKPSPTVNRSNQLPERDRNGKTVAQDDE